jgi:hypothetical protein
MAVPYYHFVGMWERFYGMAIDGWVWWRSGGFSS